MVRQEFANRVPLECNLLLLDILAGRDQEEHSVVDYPEG